jgi:hypothetical protein
MRSKSSQLFAPQGIGEILEDEKTFFHYPAKAERIPHMIAKGYPHLKPLFRSAVWSDVRRRVNKDKRMIADSACFPLRAEKWKKRSTAMIKGGSWLRR